MAGRRRCSGHVADVTVTHTRRQPSSGHREAHFSLPCSEPQSGAGSDAPSPSLYWQPRLSQTFRILAGVTVPHDRSCHRVAPAASREPCEGLSAHFSRLWLPWLGAWEPGGREFKSVLGRFLPLQCGQEALPFSLEGHTEQACGGGTGWREHPPAGIRGDTDVTHAHAGPYVASAASVTSRSLHRPSQPQCAGEGTKASRK